MADTTTPIVNLALIRIGAKPIVSITEGSPTSITALAIYSYYLKSLLQERDWRFAKLRAALTRHTITPAYGYKFAYLLPSDFLRLTKARYPQLRGLNPVAYSPGYWYQVLDVTGYPRYYDYDPVVYPGGAPYIFEVIPGVTGPPAVADQYCLLTDYDDTDVALSIDYIRNVTDESKFTPMFTELFVTKLAMELAIPITESPQKKQDLESEYTRKLNSTEAYNESLDSIADETGSQDWENAGR